MNLQELEQRIRSLESLVESSQRQAAAVQGKITRLEDIEQIKKLQRCYGYYFERGMNKEIADLFADSADAAIYFRGIGGFAGPNAKASWAKHLPGKDPAKYLHVLAMTTGIVDVDSERGTALGRWYGWGMAAVPMEEIGPDCVNNFAFGAVYENEYVKRDGVWKIKVLDVAMLFKVPKPGFVDPARFDVVYADPTEDANTREDFRKMFDFPDDIETNYPSAYTHPFHFKHPVTGEQTSEVARNAAFGLTPKNLPPQK